MRQIAPSCKALQISYLAFRLSAPICSDEHGNETDPALDPARAVPAGMLRGHGVTVI
jgi:hypothetical protein